MRVLSYSARNILKISDIDFQLEGRNLFLIGGKNGQGKTSAINALLLALCGKRAWGDRPDVPLKDGEDKGWVKVELSGDEELHQPDGMTVELYYRRKRNGEVKEEIKIVDPSGDEAAEPRTLLQQLYSNTAFDPLAFERLGKKEKRETLTRLLGLDFAAEHKQIAALKEDRKLVKKDVDRMEMRVDEMVHHKDAPDEEPNVSDLVAELDAAQKQNKFNAELRRRPPSIKGQLATTREQAEKLAAEIQELQSRLETLYRNEEKLQEELKKAEAEVAGIEDADEAAIKAKIGEAGEVAKKVRANRERAAAVLTLKKAADSAASLTEQIDAIEADIQKRLAEAEWPVEGLALGADGVLLDGLPFEQASKSQRVLASTKIGMKLNPKLRLLVCQDGNDLDQDSMAALEKMLEENDFQMLVELVTRTQADEDLCAVVIQDGEMKPAQV